MDTEAFKHQIYAEMAGMTKALQHPVRLNMLDVLAQGPASVEYLAAQTGHSIANASAHLQKLKSSRLVEFEKRGKYSFYRMANQQVFEVMCALRRLGMSQNAEISRLIHSYRAERNSLSSMSIQELARLLEQPSSDIVLLDVRPAEEYRQGHIKNAISIPADKLRERLHQLPADKSIVAYCRGSFCVMADEAVHLLREHGFEATRLEQGYPEWAAQEFPVLDI
ncbi:MAG: ArsR/SmtB family transcription factor [Cyclonatronaceae bacterium]